VSIGPEPAVGPRLPGVPSGKPRTKFCRPLPANGKSASTPGWACGDRKKSLKPREPSGSIPSAGIRYTELFPAQRAQVVGAPTANDRRKIWPATRPAEIGPSACWLRYLGVRIAASTEVDVSNAVQAFLKPPATRGTTASKIDSVRQKAKRGPARFKTTMVCPGLHNFSDVRPCNGSAARPAIGPELGVKAPPAAD